VSKLVLVYYYQNTEKPGKHYIWENTVAVRWQFDNDYITTAGVSILACLVWQNYFHMRK